MFTFISAFSPRIHAICRCRAAKRARIYAGRVARMLRNPAPVRMPFHASAATAAVAASPSSGLLKTILILLAILKSFVAIMPVGCENENKHLGVAYIVLDVADFVGHRLRMCLSSSSTLE